MHKAASSRHGEGVQFFWSLLQFDGKAIPLEDLDGVARDQTAVSRNRLVEGLAELYFARLGGVGDDERHIMAESLRQLVHEVELLVRRRLAARFSDEPDSPAELVRVARQRRSRGCPPDPQGELGSRRRRTDPHYP